MSRTNRIHRAVLILLALAWVALWFLASITEAVDHARQLSEIGGIG